MLITAYLEGGLLKFKVSCGAQRIRFSDPRRVDTGFRQMIDVSLSIEDNGGAIGKGLFAMVSQSVINLNYIEILYSFDILFWLKNLI